MRALPLLGKYFPVFLVSILPGLVKFNLTRLQEMFGTKVKLGKNYECEITGFKGMATSIVRFSSGMVQVGLQPKCGENTGTMPDAILMDVNMVRKVDDGLADKVTPQIIADEDMIPIGSDVQDKLTHMKGTVLAQMIYMNGCVRYDVAESRKASKKKILMPENKQFSHERLQVIDESKQIPNVNKDAPEKPPGGPMSRTSAARAPR